MKLEDRRQEIVELLMEAGSASLDELARRFGVSKMTIHRDLDELEAAGLLRKVRGGASIEASLRFESDYRFRARRGTDEKRRIAQAAADMVEPGMTVLVNDGTTAGMLAELLPAKRPLTVISNNMAVISALAGASGITLIALGGTYSPKFNGFFGLVAEESLSGLRADIAFLSTATVRGRVCYHMDHDAVRIKRLMIEAGARAVLMADHAKFGRAALHRLADLTAFDAVITSAPLPGDQSGPLVDAGINLIIAREEQTT